VNIKADNKTLLLYDSDQMTPWKESGINARSVVVH